MKKLLSMLLIGMLTFGIACIANATFMETSYDCVVFDDITNTYWISDFTLLSNLTYQEQISEINEWNSNDTYSSQEWGDWRIAEMVETGATFYEGYEYSFGTYEHLFTPNAGNYNGRTASQTDPLIAPNLHNRTYMYWWPDQDWLVYMDGWEVADGSKSLALGVWVVAEPVPEPTTILLLGAGLIGFAGFRKRSRKR